MYVGSITIKQNRLFLLFKRKKNTRKLVALNHRPVVQDYGSFYGIINGSFNIKLKFLSV